MYESGKLQTRSGKFVPCLLSLLRVSLILLFANVIICAKDLDRFSGIRASRHKRQNQEEDSRPHGHASVILQLEI